MSIITYGLEGTWEWDAELDGLMEQTCVTGVPGLVDALVLDVPPEGRPAFTASAYCSD